MWTNTVGLINGQFKYLTAETFGFKINANGSSMKKKQQWSIELFPFNNQVDEVPEFEYVAIKSHLGCYLAVDSFGNVTCEQKEKNEKCRFIITICSMSNGKDNEQIYWAFKNVVRSYYLGAMNDGMINCNAKMPQSRAELWHVHLIPSKGASLFSLRSIGRKRFARTLFKEENDQIEVVKVDATESWGKNTLFYFKYFEGGKYVLLTSNNNYLTCDGVCINGEKNFNKNQTNLNLKNENFLNSLPSGCFFTIEFHSGYIAFRDLKGQYLAGTGHASILKTRSNTVSKDELFEFYPAPIQLALKATFNNKWVSTKQSLDLTANQNEVTSQHEVFEFKHHPETNLWTICSKDRCYWTLSTSSVSANCKDINLATYFELKWNQDGTCSILISNEKQKWICNRKSGKLYVGSISNNQEPVKFQFKFENRNFLNLRAANNSGYVGLKNLNGSKLEINKIIPDSIIVEFESNENQNLDDQNKSGILTDSAISSGNNNVLYNYCYFKMSANNKYWSVIDNNIVVCDILKQNCAQQWIIELHTSSTVLIRTLENAYLIINNQGTLQVSNCEQEKATIWEF